ncbi:D-ribose pyranase [Oceanivirga miroungae]|uniref:D-ribose pyranase n=1 Tax=Oceanivirga miroungae TaxID=1130046 RepID=A0A6I8MA13_9FUSO|nr:D-ribose pyranase [Oceanivirga miroungae]VWL85031.1 D-ribose pyranase [Oceanivirga miroungae]
MKKNKLINSEISYVISKMGHTDSLVICDAGLPIPNDVKRIDLALEKGIPSFIDTFKVVLDELKVEAVIMASEMKEISPKLHDEIIEILSKENIKIEYVKHAEFKKETKKSMAIIRTGEYTPYANIILKSGVVF